MRKKDLTSFEVRRGTFHCYVCGRKFTANRLHNDSCSGDLYTDYTTCDEEERFVLRYRQ